MGSEMAASLRPGGCRGLGPVGPSVMDTAEERAGRIPPPHLTPNFGELIDDIWNDFFQQIPKIVT